MTYQDFLRGKMTIAESFGFEPMSPHDASLKPHQRDISLWACQGGRRAIFAGFGLGKTRMHLQVAKWIVERSLKPETGNLKAETEDSASGIAKRYLIVAPLGVRQEFTLVEGPAMGMEVVYCRSDAEVAACASPFIITNYERVRDGGITLDPEVFAGAGLDEASVLRSFGSKTYQTFLKLFHAIPYRYVFTATPSPNRYKELIHYAGFLGVMDTGEALTRFFKRDSSQAGNLQLYPHMEERFWLWVASWAVFLQKPSDLGYSDVDYDLPKMNVHWHMVGVDHTRAWQQTDSWGQAQLFMDQSSGLRELAISKRESMLARIVKAKEIMGAGENDEGGRRKDETGNLKREMQSASDTAAATSEDPMLAPALAVWASGAKVTIPLLQRRLHVGYVRARELVELVKRRLEVGKQKRAEARSQLPLEGIGADGRHWILWHDLEAERHLIGKLIPQARTVYGTQDLDIREDLIMGFSRGEYPVLATKPVIAGSGCNFQKHCADAIFVGSTYKFNDIIQAVHRIYRFQQSREVNIHFIFSESEAPVIETLKAKWRRHDVLVEKMAEILRKYRLTLHDMKLTRDLGCNRAEVAGEKFRVIHNDCVEELRAWPDNEVDLIVTSIPFGNQYEYSPNFNDFGHNPDNAAFFQQMDFLVPNLLRVLKPGRLACIHVKDRIRFGNVTGMGMPTVDPFSDDTVASFRKHGFAFMGRITIDTDVVRENNQTYRLGWSENAKDSTKMGVGMPEYVLLFRKLPTDTSNSYADVPVTKDKTVYTRAQWQIDAAALWKSDGNRLADPEILVNIPHDAIGRVWREHCRKSNYDYQEHVEVGRELEARGKLPSSYMLFPPISMHPGVWTDIIRMRVLNSEQSKRNQENHVCPLQLDIVKRLVMRYSNPGDLVLDPFGGIMTVPYVAVSEGRRGVGIELNEEYWRCGVGYCEMAEREHGAMTLFDMTTLGVIAA
jgi:DNA modification methylase